MNDDNKKAVFGNEELFPKNKKEEKALKEIFEILLKSSQIDFSHYRDTTVLRRLSRRMKLIKAETFEEYLLYLKGNQEEVDNLYSDFLLCFTEFFRDPEVFLELKKKIFPQLVKDKAEKDPIRIWVAGCSTGEEAYSFVIALHEFLVEIKSNARVQLFGTDLMEKNILKARSGLYSNKIRENVSEERLERFFEQTPDGLKVVKHIREMCTFGVQDITKDPPFSNIDLVSCRNVLIYFDDTFQEIAIPSFHFSLNPEGYLLLGTSETMLKFTQYFTSYNQNNNLFVKRATETRHSYDFAVNNKNRNNSFRSTDLKSRDEGKSVELSEKINKILLETYAPSGVLIDSNMLILRFFGNPSPFLELGQGEASLALSKMAEDKLMPDIFLAIKEAQKKEEKVIRRNVSFKHLNELITTNISVVPIHEVLSDSYNFLVLFEEIKDLALSSQTELSKGDGREIDSLKREILSIKDNLKFIVDEKDEVNQSLWLANAEVLSTNEELQSVNEETEAMKEELEAGNEELMSLNEELQWRNTELIEAKDLLQNSEKRYRSLFDNMQNGFALHEVITNDFGVPVDYRFLEINPAFTTLTTLTRDIIGKTVLEIIPDTEAVWIEKYGKVALTGKEIRFEQFSGGLAKWYSVLAFSPEKNKFATVFEDITERKQFEELIKEKEELFSISAREALVVSKKGIILDSNLAIEKMFGYTKREAVGKSIFDLTASGESKILVKEKVELGSEDSYVAHGLKKDGTDFPLKIRGKTLENGNRITSLIDITEERQMLEKAEEANVAKSLFLATMSHELRTPMNAVIGALDILAELDPNEGQKEMLNIALQGGEDLLSTIKDILEYSRIESGKLTLEEKDFNIRTLIKDFTASFICQAELRHLDLDYFISDDIPNYIKADSLRIKQILINLVSNAVKFTEVGGIIISCSIKEELEDSYVLNFAVKDSGIGLDIDRQKHIFDRFTQVDSSFTRKYEGVGLGLAICKKLVDTMNGEIGVESEVGKGSIFWFTLKVKKSEKASDTDSFAHKQKNNEEKVNKAKKILLVDDREAHRLVIKIMIESLGYKIDEAQSGDEAVEILGKQKYDLVIMDIVMPKMCGIQTTKKIKEDRTMMNFHTPIIAISAEGALEGKRKYLEAGMNDYISKPIRLDDIIKVLNKYLPD